jgi:hypothetical protein
MIGCSYIALRGLLQLHLLRLLHMQVFIHVTVAGVATVAVAMAIISTSIFQSLYYGMIRYSVKG